MGARFVVELHVPLAVLWNHPELVVPLAAEMRGAAAMALRFTGLLESCWICHLFASTSAVLSHPTLWRDSNIDFVCGVLGLHIVAAIC